MTLLRHSRLTAIQAKGFILCLLLNCTHVRCSPYLLQEFPPCNYSWKASFLHIHVYLKWKNNFKAQTSKEDLNINVMFIENCADDLRLYDIFIAEAI